MLTYVCVILIDFQAHRDAFIQNMGNNITSAMYCQYRIAVNTVDHRTPFVSTIKLLMSCMKVISNDDDDDNNNNNLWLYVNVFNWLTWLAVTTKQFSYISRISPQFLNILCNG